MQFRPTTNYELRIYKDKYNEVTTEGGRNSGAQAQTKDGTPEKTRNKSRTRSIFARKKSLQP
jgi:hypothetical protein